MSDFCFVFLFVTTSTCETIRIEDELHNIKVYGFQSTSFSPLMLHESSHSKDTDPNTTNAALQFFYVLLNIQLITSETFLPSKTCFFLHHFMPETLRPGTVKDRQV